MQDTHHLGSGLSCDPHLVEHLVALLHDERALVGVRGHVAVVHFNHLHVRFDPANNSFSLKDPILIPNTSYVKFSFCL